MYYYYQNKEYTQPELIRHLYECSLKNKLPVSYSNKFDVLDSRGEWYTFFFKFDNCGELICFTCKKQIDIKGSSLRDCWKYILEGCARGKEVKGFSKNTDVYQYLKLNPNKPYRLERKEPNGSITVKGVIYDTILDTVVVNRVPYKKND